MLKNVVLLVFLLSALPVVAVGNQAASETTLAAVRRSDAADRDASGKLTKLTPAEHMRRAAVYLSVRAFAEARDHGDADRQLPADPRVPEALLGIGRSYFLGKIYPDGYKIFNQLVQDYGATKEAARR